MIERHAERYTRTAISQIGVDHSGRIDHWRGEATLHLQHRDGRRTEGAS